MHHRSIQLTTSLISKSNSSLGRVLLPIVLALGSLALSAKVQGADPSDTAYGPGTLINDTSGYQNSAFGYYALFSNTTGNNNTGNGAFVLYYNTTGIGNAGYGGGALNYNTTGSHNTASGELALFHNTTGSYNTAIGASALSSNTAHLTRRLRVTTRFSPIQPDSATPLTAPRRSTLTPPELTTRRWALPRSIPIPPAVITLPSATRLS